MRPDVICLTQGGIRRMGCANSFSGHRLHCSPSLVDAISCSCKARQAHASSKCSWFGCHTASAGTMTEYVWTLSRKLTKRGHIARRIGWFIVRWKEWWQKSMMIIVMIMMLVIDGDGHRRWWWREVDGGYVKWLLKMLHLWCAAVIKHFTKFDLHKQS